MTKSFKPSRLQNAPKKTRKHVKRFYSTENIENQKFYIFNILMYLFKTNNYINHFLKINSPPSYTVQSYIFVFRYTYITACILIFKLIGRYSSFKQHWITISINNVFSTWLLINSKPWINTQWWVYVSKKDFKFYFW